jgi:hypothetical protein
MNQPVDIDFTKCINISVYLLSLPFSYHVQIWEASQTYKRHTVLHHGYREIVFIRLFVCRENLIRVAFQCLQLVVTDFLPVMPWRCLPLCVDTAAKFGSQTQELNISLTAVGLMASGDKHSWLEAFIYPGLVPQAFLNQELILKQGILSHIGLVSSAGDWTVLNPLLTKVNTMQKNIDIHPCPEQDLGLCSWFKQDTGHIAIDCMATVFRDPL